MMAPPDDVPTDPLASTVSDDPNVTVVPARITKFKVEPGCKRVVKVLGV